MFLANVMANNVPELDAPLAKLTSSNGHVDLAVAGKSARMGRSSWPMCFCPARQTAQGQIGRARDVIPIHTHRKIAFCTKKYVFVTKNLLFFAAKIIFFCDKKKSFFCHKNAFFSTQYDFSMSAQRAE